MLNTHLNHSEVAADDFVPLLAVIDLSGVGLPHRDKGSVSLAGLEKPVLPGIASLSLRKQIRTQNRLCHSAS